MNYPELLFRQIDRVMMIVSAPTLSVDMLRRSVDGLLCLVSFANPGDLQIETIESRDGTIDIYSKSLKSLKVDIAFCEKKGLLSIRWKRDLTLEGDDESG